jgi:hypothetical protein
MGITIGEVAADKSAIGQPGNVDVNGIDTADRITGLEETRPAGVGVPRYATKSGGKTSNQE